MKIGIEDYRRRLKEFQNNSEFIEIYYRGKLVNVLMPVNHYKSEPTGSTAQNTPNLQVQPIEPTGSLQDTEIIKIKCDKCQGSYEASEIKAHWEDGEEHQACVYCKGLKKRVEAPKRVKLDSVKMNDKMRSLIERSARGTA